MHRQWAPELLPLIKYEEKRLYFVNESNNNRYVAFNEAHLFKFNSIQFYLYSAFNKGALSQSCFTENRPLMSKLRATVARKNSLADNRKKP